MAMKRKIEELMREARALGEPKSDGPPAKRCMFPEYSEIFVSKDSLEPEYLIVVDFESTCWGKTFTPGKTPIPEIIEYPAVLLDLKSDKIISEFRTYVKPTKNPTLSQFCKNLTGISQSQVDEGITLQECLDKFDNWITDISKQFEVCCDHSVPEYNCCLAAWTDSHLATYLKRELDNKKIEVSSGIFNKWVCVKDLYLEYYLGKYRDSLERAVQTLGLQFEGKKNSGLDDAKNVVKIIQKMRRDGHKIHITSKLKE